LLAAIVYLLLWIATATIGISRLQEWEIARDEAVYGARAPEFRRTFHSFRVPGPFVIHAKWKYASRGAYAEGVLQAQWRPGRLAVEKDQLTTVACGGRRSGWMRLAARVPEETWWQAMWRRPDNRSTKG
jgi:hypothetical protein